MKLTWLNLGGEAAERQKAKIKELMGVFSEDLTVLEVGSAYGGAVQEIATILGKRGIVYGYDTFEGHPKDLSGDLGSSEANCMDYWYREDVYGKEKLDYKYQSDVLKKEGLLNAHLVKGRINEDSFNDIKKIHFAMIDLDLVKPTKTVYEAIKSKIVKGGYIMFHDYADNHLPLLLEFIDTVVIPSGLWEVEPHKESVFIFLKRK